MRTSQVLDLTGKDDRVVSRWASQLPMESEGRKRVARRWTASDITILLCLMKVMERGFSEKVAIGFVSAIQPQIARLAADPKAEAWLNAWPDAASAFGWSTSVVTDRQAGMDVVEAHSDVAIFSIHKMVWEAFEQITQVCNDLQLRPSQVFGDE